MNFNLGAMKQTVIATLTTVGLKVLGALAIWIIGRWLIGLALQAKLGRGGISLRGRCRSANEEQLLDIVHSML